MVLLKLKKTFSTSSKLNVFVKNLAVIGSGLMGTGIAQVSAQAKLNVTLVDQNQDALKTAQKKLYLSLTQLAQKKFENNEAQKNFVKEVIDRVKFSTELKSAVKNVDLVIEAIIENVEAKQNLLKLLENFVQSCTLIATNTSSLKLSEIGKNLKNKQNFGGLHFFNPVPLMKLLEVVRHSETSNDTFDSLINYGKNVGKTTVACKDTPGFIVNRLLIPYMLEAIKMLERGDALKEDIDTGMKLGAGYPMGPFELADYVGLDTFQFIQKGWSKNYPNELLYQSSKILDGLVAEGKLGRKTGEGFYKYNVKM